MKTYAVKIKSYSRQPDWEGEVKANNKQEAINKLDKQGITINKTNLKEV